MEIEQEQIKNEEEIKTIRIEVECNEVNKNKIKENIKLAIENRLMKIESSNDNFWKELDSVKFELFDHKNEFEKISNELSLSYYKSHEMISNSRIEKFDISKKIKEESSFISAQNKSALIKGEKVNNSSINKTPKNKLIKSEKNNSIKSNYNTENKMIDIDIQIPVNLNKSGKMKVSNSHSPPKKSKLTIKMENHINSSIKAQKRDKPLNTVNSTGNNQSNNIKPVKIESSPFVKKNGGKTNLSVKTFSPVTSKKEIPASATNKINNTNGKTKPQTTKNKKNEDPKQIEINLSDDINFDRPDNGLYYHVNNQNNIVINNNDEEESSNMNPMNSDIQEPVQNSEINNQN